MNDYFKFWKMFLAKAKNKTLTVEEYDKECSRADWFYYFSDMNLSPLAMDTLLEVAKLDERFAAIYNREHAKRFNNESFYPIDNSERSYSYPFPSVKPAE